MTVNHYVATFPNIGFVGATATDNELEPILSEIKKISDDFENSRKSTTDFKLNQEYCLDSASTHAALLDIVTPLVHSLNNNFFHKPKISKLKISAAWVNFQKKHEFARPHAHVGDFSFVLWIKLPFNIADETENNKVEAASFTFHYTDALGKIKNWAIPADHTYEKRVIVFPSDMTHSVYPFYSSDDYRIVVAGNIVITE